MDEVEVEAHAERSLDEPVLIEGLPGVGHVGKLAAEHLVEEFDGELVRRVHSEHLPPQVAVADDGTATLAAADLHAVTADGRDLLILGGDYQAGTSVGHYRLTETFLDLAESFGVTEVIALGGVPTGEMVEDHEVIGAVTGTVDRDRLTGAGVEFRAGEPAGGIVGTSGLLLGLAKRRDLPATCLMGETSGYLVDPASAQAVLETLGQLLGIEVDFTRLEERAAEMEEVAREIQQMQGGGGEQTSQTDEDLRYFD